MHDRSKASSPPNSPVRRASDRGFAALLPKPRAPRPQAILRRFLKPLSKHRKKVAIAMGIAVLLIGGVVLISRALRKGKRNGGPTPTDAATAGVHAEKRPAIADALDHLNQTVMEKTKHHFYAARSMVEMTARMLSQYSSLTRDGFFERYCLDVLEKFPQVDNFYIADAGGSRVIAARKDGIISDVIDRTGTEPVRTEKRWDAAGKLRSVEKHTESQLRENPKLGGLDDKGRMYDPRERPWYKKAEEQRATCWSDVYVFNVRKVPGITVACPTVGPGGRPLFVVAADFELEKISSFVAELDVGKQGIAFIVNGTGDLVAYPVPKKVLKMQDGKPVFAKAVDVVPDWVRKALEAFEKNHEEVFAYAHKNARYIASFASFPKSFGTDWRIVVVAPEEDLLRVVGGYRKRRGEG